MVDPRGYLGNAPPSQEAAQPDNPLSNSAKAQSSHPQ